MARLIDKLMRRKAVERDMMKTELKRCLRTIDLIFIGIGAMVGSGMYVLTGQVAHSITGPAIIICLVIAGIFLLSLRKVSIKVQMKRLSFLFPPQVVNTVFLPNEMCSIVVFNRLFNK